MTGRLHQTARDARALVRGGVGVQLVEGTLKGSGRPVALTFVGARKHVAECRDFFASPPVFAPRSVTHPDVMLIAEPVPVPHADALRYHPFFDAVLDVRETVEAQIQAVRSKAHRRRLRRIFRSKAWRWSVAEEPADFERFFTEVHRPYIQQRFGERARIDNLETLRRRFEKGGRVLTVTENGEAVCGAVLFDHGDGLDYDRNGFRLDSLKTPLVLAERTAALELAVFQLAQEVKAQRIELGFCRALLNDGLFTHKRRLGCRFVPQAGTGRYQIWVRPELRPEFFAGAPMVVGPCGEFEAHLGFVAGSAPMRKVELRALLKNFALPSVRRAVVWTNAKAADSKRQVFEEALKKALGTRPVELREV